MTPPTVAARHRHPSASWDLGRLGAAVSGRKLDPGLGLGWGLAGPPLVSGPANLHAAYWSRMKWLKYPPADEAVVRPCQICRGTL